MTTFYKKRFLPRNPEYVFLDVSAHLFVEHEVSPEHIPNVATGGLLWGSNQFTLCIADFAISGLPPVVFAVVAHPQRGCVGNTVQNKDRDSHTGGFPQHLLAPQTRWTKRGLSCFLGFSCFLSAPLSSCLVITTLSCCCTKIIPQHKRENGFRRFPTYGLGDQVFRCCRLFPSARHVPLLAVQPNDEDSLTCPVQ